MSSSQWVPAKRASRSRLYSNIRILRRTDLHTPLKAYVQSNKSATPTTPVATSSPPVFSFRVRTASPTKTNHDKRMRQWLRWSNEVIPKLVPAFLELLRTSNNLRAIDRANTVCACGPEVRRLTVICLSFDGISRRQVCSCNTAVQLVVSGYFPCAPLLPSLAIDIRMLEFMRQLHLRSAPNRSAWAAALEAFYASQGFGMKGQEVIRRKLAKAAQYYTLLRSRCNQVVRVKLSAAASANEEVSDDWEDVSPTYLASCCPACFGNLRHDPDRVVDVIVCLDANFTQKRRTPTRGGGRDPPIVHPASCFLSEAELSRAKDRVEQRRGQPSGFAPSVPDDAVAPGMKVTNAVLEACGESFQAADEKRAKASTKFFSDTGLMALLCRHDQVLWLANMTSAGERQYYAFALIQKLFDALDADIRVGILYDIGCQLERSARKWNIIPELLPRIVWGISVFHAYGHQWPCQLVYHPRKCRGFGLSDGEGCERFWSAIAFLISILRVSGYHQRILSLDFQVEFLHDQSLLQMGKWISRKWQQCLERLAEAYSELDRIGLDESLLEQQWEAQVNAQTKPLVRATDSLAKQEIRSILDLMEYSRVLGKEIQGLDKKIVGVKAGVEIQELLELREGVVVKQREVDKQVEERRARLGVSERENLRKLLGNRYLALLLKARALKERLRAKLQSRKFELERVDKAYRRGTHNESKLQSQILSGIAKKESGISALVTRFNKYCDEMKELVQKGKAPIGCIAPKPIPSASIFNLDVDDPIWDDAGLQDPHSDGNIPLWLGDEQVRAGIKAWLMVERCEEEVERLKSECVALQQWIREEWDILVKARDNIDDVNIYYQWTRRHEELTILYGTWKKDISIIPYDGIDALWGPETPLVATDQALTSTDFSKVTGDDEDDQSCSESVVAGDDQLLMELENLGLDVEETL